MSLQQDTGFPRLVNLPRFQEVEDSAPQGGKQQLKSSTGVSTNTHKALPMGGALWRKTRTVQYDLMDQIIGLESDIAS